MRSIRFLQCMVPVVLMMLSTLTAVNAQQSDLQYFRPQSRAGVNVFETPKHNDVPFEGLKVRIGGDFALQFQGLEQTNAGDSLVELAKNFNLPTANLNIDVQ